MPLGDLVAKGRPLAAIDLPVARSAFRKTERLRVSRGG
jgi:hypothetical protein